MKLTKITSAAIIVIMAMLLTGCQDEQLANCQQKNTELQAQVEAQKETITKKETIEKNSLTMITLILNENVKLRSQIAELKKAQQPKPDPKKPAKKPEMTPEKKAEMKKALQKLFDLQKKSAEKMKKEANK
ncbi:MAG: hypothetical protein FVQ82_05030 [Planctomycetes bacterium]|nr:hypothetical protein [Planctomycetota bacterium]